MTPYEAATLDIARWTVGLQVASAVISLFALVAAIAAGWTILAQLRASQWNAMLQFEMDMNARHRDLGEIAQEIMLAETLTLERRKILIARKDALVEGYLNSLDRFASSILHGQFPDRKLRPEYRGYIESALREFKDKFGPGTRYRNVAKLHDKWSDT